MSISVDFGQGARLPPSRTSAAAPPPRPRPPPSTGFGRSAAAASASAAVAAAVAADCDRNAAAIRKASCGFFTGPSSIRGGAIHTSSLPGLGIAGASASFPGPRNAEASALIDGLERENALLHAQLQRCFAHERTLRAEVDSYREQLGAHGQLNQQHHDAESSSLAMEGARLRNVVQQQGELAEAIAAALEKLQGDQVSQDARVASLQSQAAAAEAEIGALTCELESLRRFVLPRAPADADAQGARAPLGASTLQVALHRARHVTVQLKLACEAKFETLDRVQQQLRARLEAQALGNPQVVSRRSENTSHPQFALADAAVAAQEKAALLQLRLEVQHVRGEVEQERVKTEQAVQRATKFEQEHLRVAQGWEAAQQSLRVREAEVRELQLISKYFVGRAKPPTQQEIDVAELAEELRKRCAGLAEEAERLRLERDLLRAERNRASHTPGGRCDMASLDHPASSDLDLAQLAQRLLDQKRVVNAGGA